MDFFTKLGTKAGETFQNLKESDKTKKAMSYAEIPGLTIQIGKQESILKKAYMDIGKAYYELHTDDAEEAFAPSIETIKECQAKIDELKAEIEARKAYDPKSEAGEVVDDTDPLDEEEVVVEAIDVTKQAEQVKEVVVENVAEAAEEIKEKVQEVNDIAQEVKETTETI